MSLYNIEGFTYFYPENKVPALHEINLEINHGDFILLKGESGSGKSTLLKLLAGLVPSFYGGKVGGKASFDGIDVVKNKKVFIPRVGILFQDPEKQIICSTVESEVMYGLKNIGCSNSLNRLDNALKDVGINHLAKRKTNCLSSGEKQKTAIASIMAIDPEVLLLDEPFSQIDPDSAADIMNVIFNFSKQVGKTVIISEHRVDKCTSFVNRVITMGEGKIISDEKVNNQTVLASKKYRFKKKEISFNKQMTDLAISIKNLRFSYKEAKDVLNGVSFDIYKGEILGILGDNGAGKSTLLKNIIGLLESNDGEVLVSGVSTKGLKIIDIAKKIAYVGQNPDDYLFENSVKDEIHFTLNNFQQVWTMQKTDKLIQKLGISKILDRNPRDLSTGEKQRTAIASMLCLSQKIFILDEPTRGLDKENKIKLGSILRSLNNCGTTIILVTHDLEFADEICSRIAIFKEGQLKQYLEAEKEESV